MILEVFHREPKPPEPVCPLTIYGQLEYDWQRGVLYFHGNDGLTKLRICQLPKRLKTPGTQVHIDLTHMKGVIIMGDPDDAQ